MNLRVRLGVMIVGAVLGGVLAQILLSDVALVGMVLGAGVGWFVTGERVAGRLRREK